MTTDNNSPSTITRIVSSVARGWSDSGTLVLFIAKTRLETKAQACSVLWRNHGASTANQELDMHVRDASPPSPGRHITGRRVRLHYPATYWPVWSGRAFPSRPNRSIAFRHSA